jgi:hypothetical protein
MLLYYVKRELARAAAEMQRGRQFPAKFCTMSVTTVFLHSSNVFEVSYTKRSCSRVDDIS